jgi:DNA polymerase III alpha subunit (gram-positive type)
MLYVSIDIETSGLNPKKNQILSFGAIIEDTSKSLSFEDCPKFYATVIHRNIKGSPKALLMNMDVIKDISDYIENDRNDALNNEVGNYNPIFVETFTLTSSFISFLDSNGIKADSRFQRYKINVAGKNFAAFDMLFLNNVPGWVGFIDIRKRILDPAILYFDVNNDDTLPSLDVCKKRANIDGNVSHNALLDAWDVIQVLRNKLT